MNKLSRALQVIFLLGPRVLALRSIRERTRKGEEQDEEKITKEARKLVNAFIRLAPTYVSYEIGKGVLIFNNEPVPDTLPNAKPKSRI